MSSEQVTIVLAGAVALALVLTVLALVTIRAAIRRSRELSEALAQAEIRAGELSARLARLEHRAVEPADEAAQPGVHRAVVVDRWTGDPLAGDVVGERIDGRLFADIVARETTVRAAGLVHGLRVALSPENRNRIRFEVRQEIKRSRRRRRDDLKAALRDLRARERAATAVPHEADRDDEDAA